MARPLRIEYPGAVYHLTSRGNERKPIFLDDVDRRVFLVSLEAAVLRYRWLCYAYCLMGNHYHLVVETADPWDGLKAGMVLGSESFAAGLLPLTKGKERVPELPKEQRFAARPALAILFDGCGGNRPLRNRRILTAVLVHGYSQRQVANHLGLHFASVSRVMRERRTDARMSTR